MVIIIGLVILVAAVAVGVGGVLSNRGTTHALGHPFAVFGYHVTGSTGRLFLYGVVLGALGMLGLGLLLAGARRTSRRGGEARRGLARSQRETAAVSQERDELLDQRETARAYTASAMSSSPADDSGSLDGDGDGQRGRRHPFRRRPAEPAAGRQAADIPAAPPAPAE